MNWLNSMLKVRLRVMNRIDDFSHLPLVASIALVVRALLQYSNLKLTGAQGRRNMELSARGGQ